ncbi:conserved hypothetical protein [Listeria monocytogenes]|nr:conserved hypothetical protein [Listeria monocytogenes]
MILGNIFSYSDTLWAIIAPIILILLFIGVIAYIRQIKRRRKQRR